MEDPYQTKEDLKIGGVNLSETWRGAKRVDNWKDPFDVGAAAAAHTAEFLLPQSKEEVMMELATLGQGKKIKLGRKLAHAALRDIPIYQKGEKYVSGKLNQWFSKSRFRSEPKPAYSNRPDADGLYTEAPIDEQSMWEAQQRKLLEEDQVKSIKQITLEEKLKDPRIEKFLTGASNLKDKELSNLIQDFSDREDFMSIVSTKIDELKAKYPHLVRKLDNQKETIALRWHHVNPSKGPIDLYKGLTDEADRAVLRDSLVEEFEVFSGNHPLNNKGLSIDVHDTIHDWLGETIGLRADILKHKWANAAGIDVGDLVPGQGFMSNHMTLSPQGRAAFDAWFSTLSPTERLPYIRDYGKIIKESEGILGDLMQQYDSLFAVPEGFHLHPDNEVLLRFLDEIPTDGSRLLQKDIKNIVEQVNREMPRGTVDIINEEGVIKQLNLETDIYKRIDELKTLLDQKGLSRRAINSYTKELKGLEKGVLQKTLDIEGANKQGAWKKRLEQEKNRRESK